MLRSILQKIACGNGDLGCGCENPHGIENKGLQDPNQPNRKEEPHETKLHKVR